MNLTSKALLVSLSFAMLTTTSCMMEEDLVAKAGKASIQIDLSTAADFSTETKAVNESDYSNLDNYQIEIWQNETLKKEFPHSERPASIELPNGTYTLKAYYGTDAAYSRTGFRMEGSSIFNVEGKDLTVTCNCYPTVGKLQVIFDANMVTYFSDYQVVYTTSSIMGNSVTWSKNDLDPWYIKLPQNGETVTATIKLTPKSEYVTNGASTTVTRTRVLKPTEMWTLEVAPNYTSTNGTLGISISIDTTTEDKTIEIIVPAEWGTDSPSK